LINVLNKKQFISNNSQIDSIVKKYL